MSPVLTLVVTLYWVIYSHAQETTAVSGPSTTCGPPCTTYCPSGNVLDSMGCPTCSCRDELIPYDDDETMGQIVRYIQRSPQTLEQILRFVVDLPFVDLKVEILKTISQEIPMDVLHIFSLNLVLRQNASQIPSMLKLMDNDQFHDRIDLRKLATDVALSMPQREDRDRFLSKLSQLGLNFSLSDVIGPLSLQLPVADKIVFLSDVLGHLVDWKIEKPAPYLRGLLESLPFENQLDVLRLIKTRLRRFGIDWLELVSDVALSISDAGLPQFITQVSKMFTDRFTQVDFLVSISIKKRKQVDQFLRVIQTSLPDEYEGLTRRLLRVGDEVMDSIIVDAFYDYELMSHQLLEEMAEKPNESRVLIVFQKSAELLVAFLQAPLLLAMSKYLSPEDLYNVTMYVAAYQRHDDILYLIRYIDESQLGNLIDLPRLVTDVGVIMPRDEERIKLLLNLQHLHAEAAINVTEVVVSVGNRLPVDKRPGFMSEVLSRASDYGMDNAFLVARAWLAELPLEKHAELLRRLKGRPGLGLDLLELVSDVALSLPDSDVPRYIRLVSVNVSSIFTFNDLAYKIAMKKHSVGQLENYLVFITLELPTARDEIIQRLRRLGNKNINKVIDRLRKGALIPDAIVDSFSAFLRTNSSADHLTFFIYKYNWLLSVESKVQFVTKLAQKNLSVDLTDESLTLTSLYVISQLDTATTIKAMAEAQAGKKFDPSKVSGNLTWAIDDIVSFHQGLSQLGGMKVNMTRIVQTVTGWLPRDRRLVYMYAVIRHLSGLQTGNVFQVVGEWLKILPLDQQQELLEMIRTQGLGHSREKDKK